MPLLEGLLSTIGGGILNRVLQKPVDSAMGNMGLLAQNQPQGLLGRSPGWQDQVVTVPQAVPQETPKTGFGSPDFSYAMAQLGGILAGPDSANAQYANSLTDLRKQRELIDYQKQQDQSLFGGSGFDSQLVRQRASEYMKAGLPQDEALSRAANDVLQTKQEYVKDAYGNLTPIGRRALPPIQGTATTIAPTVTQTEDLPPPAVPVSQGGLLPPPSGQGEPDMGMFEPQRRISIPQTGIPAVDVETAKKAAEMQLNKSAEYPRVESSLRKAIEDMDATISTIDRVIPQVSSGSAGAGSLLSSVPGSRAADLEANLQTIGASTAFDALQEMRNNSKTGGALGSIAVPELELLKASKGAIGQKQSPEQLKTNLLKVRDNYIKTRQRVLDAFSKDYGSPPEWAKSYVSEPGSIPSGVDPALWEVMTPEERKLWQ